MDTATLDELRALRARAYGPSADIEHDPVALRRLQELEAQREAGAVATPAPAPPPAPAPAAAPVTVEAQAQAPAEAPVESPPQTPTASAVEASAEQPGADGADADPPVSARRRPRRLGLWWGLSLVAAAALAASATYAVTRVLPVSVSSGAEQIATLEPISTAPALPSGWFGIGPSSAAYEFYGLTLFQTSSGVMGTPGSDCFAAIPTAQLPEEDADPNSWSFTGNVYSGCRVGDFPATVQMPVDTSAPKDLSDRYPIGSALQFVLVDGRVGVFLDLE
ncbi:hypothetical protein [Microbacterium sp. HJ5]